MIYIVLICIVAFALLTFYKAKIKGYLGERKVSAILMLLNSANYRVINNLVLDYNGKTSQIDHVIVSNYGVFVIETKNYKGWILGTETAEFWTQVIFRRKHRFYNPIRQNNSHILALKKVLNKFPSISYHSIIVFSSKAVLKVNVSAKVIYTRNVFSAIKAYDEPILSDEERDNIYDILTLLNSSDNFNKSDHLNSIRRSVQRREESIVANRCPNCGSDLILRKGHFGQFLGCRSYPRCKFTRNL